MSKNLKEEIEKVMLQAGKNIIADPHIITSDIIYIMDEIGVNI